MSTILRFESKYLINHADYHRIRADIRYMCHLDEHSACVKDNKYFVRSLYFDDEYYSAYVQKVTGENIRNKLRIRTYSKDRLPKMALMVEQKIRVGRLIHKHKTVVSLQEYDEFMSSGYWSNQSDDVLVDCQRLVKLQNLTPKVIVDYYREAWTSRLKDGVRISFDHNLQYAASTDLFSDQHRYVSDLNRLIVMEIKCGRDDIKWISDLVRLHGLRAEPNSKYVNAIDHTQAQIWH